MKTPCCLPPLPPFSNFVQHSPPTSLSPPIPTSTVLSVVLFLWLNGWSHYIWCAILFNDNMDLVRMSSLGALVPEGPWHVFYATRYQVYWGLTCNVVFYWYSDLILHTYTHTQTHAEHTQGPVDWHTHVNISLHHLLCAPATFITLNEIIHWYQKFTFQCLFFSKIIHL